MRGVPRLARTVEPLDFIEARRRHLDEIERRIHAHAGTGRILEMMEYHLASGGKRMRALLPPWLCHNLGGRVEDALEAGVAAELLHNATLVHDDIQDGDTHRRGRETVWRRFGVAQAINVGDALIFEAFGRLARIPNSAPLLEHVAVALTRTVEGQAADLELQGVTSADALPRPAEWDRAVRGKTGALLGACLRMGAWAARRGEAFEESAAQYGEDMGVLFQVQDDYLDLTGDKGRQRRGSDLMEGKLSFPVVWAFAHGAPAVTAPIFAILAKKREDRTWEMVDEALVALHRSGALDATAAWLRAAADDAQHHPIAELVPGWAEQCLKPVAHAL